MGRIVVVVGVWGWLCVLGFGWVWEMGEVVRFELYFEGLIKILEFCRGRRFFVELGVFL